MKKIPLIFSILGLAIFLPAHGIERPGSHATPQQIEVFNQRYQKAIQAGASGEELLALQRRFLQMIQSIPSIQSRPATQTSRGLVPAKAPIGGKK